MAISSQFSHAQHVSRITTAQHAFRSSRRPTPQLGGKNRKEGHSCAPGAILGVGLNPCTRWHRRYEMFTIRSGPS